MLIFDYIFSTMRKLKLKSLNTFMNFYQKKYVDRLFIYDKINYHY